MQYKGEIYMKNIIAFLDSLPITSAERKEIEVALDRASSIYWVNARAEIKTLCEDRIEEKKDRKIKALLTEDKINQLVKIDDVLFAYIEDLWGYGYSSAAIAKGLSYAVSSARISQKLEPLGIKKRGQVIELLEDFETEFDLKRWRIANQGQYNTGPRIKQEEKEKFRELYKKGYSITYISQMTGRSETAIRKWVK
jgi:SOS response regulatory protein OraA/RecX